MRRSAAGAIAVALIGCGPSVATSAPSARSDLTGVLETALDDERKAEATYAAVIAAHGPVRPFVNIIEAERRHARMLIDLFESRGIPVPANRWTAPQPAPASVAQACVEAIAAERDNIALYDRLLPTVADPEAERVLTALQAASRDRHLPAFERCGGGRGPGGGRGRGA